MATMTNTCGGQKVRPQLLPIAQPEHLPSQHRDQTPFQQVFFAPHFLFRAILVLSLYHHIPPIKMRRKASF